jgi:predicted metal-dependent phosphoesterase TrpH
LTDSYQSEKRWLKAELHSHCNMDPEDYRFCNYSPEELILHAARLRYDVLAITCHDLDIWNEDLAQYAASFGITLIPGMEVIAESTRHTLAYNFQAKAEDLNTIKKIRSLQRDDTLVIASHPFFPGRSCLRHHLENNIDAFDAIECSGFYTKNFDFNKRGESLAREKKKPIVGNGDIHYLWQLGRTFTWIYSEPGIIPIVNAIKQGKVKLQKSPLTWFEAAKWWANTILRLGGFPINRAPAQYRPKASRVNQESMSISR